MRKLSALLMVFALGVAACGDSADTTTTGTVPPETTAAVTTTEPTPTTTTSQPTTTTTAATTTSAPSLVGTAQAIGPGLVYQHTARGLVDVTAEPPLPLDLWSAGGRCLTLSEPEPCRLAVILIVDTPLESTFEGPSVQMLWLERLLGRDAEEVGIWELVNVLDLTDTLDAGLFVHFDCSVTATGEFVAALVSSDTEVPMRAWLIDLKQLDFKALDAAEVVCASP